MQYVLSMSRIQPSDKGVTVNVYKHLYDKLKERKYEIKTYVNALLEKELKRLELLEIIKPYLTIVHSEGNSVFVNDKKQNRVMEVRFFPDKKTVECIEDKTDNCIHVAYCLGELGRFDLVT